MEQFENIRTAYFNLPNSIKAFTIATPDGWFTICLNQNHSHEQNLISYKHELEHILCGDFDKKCSADLIEIISHR